MITVLIVSDVTICVEEVGTEGCADSTVRLGVALSLLEVITVSDGGRTVSSTETDAEVSEEKLVNSQVDAM